VPINGCAVRNDNSKIDNRLLIMPACKMHAVVRILVAQPRIMYWILQELLSFRAAHFRAYLRGLVVPRFKAVCGRDGSTGHFDRRRHENLSWAISWLTFIAGGAADAK
jgi:hypothetical protein